MRRRESLEPVDDEQVAKPSHVGVTVRPRIRCDQNGASYAFNSDGIRRRERFPKHPVAGREVHAKDVNGWRPDVSDAVDRIHVSAVVAPLKRDISRLERWDRLGVAAMNRKEQPRGTGATEDGVVIAHGCFAAERHTNRCNRTRQTVRDLLDVASGFPVSRVAREHNALRVAEPRASSEVPSSEFTTSPLGNFTVEPAPAGRRIRFPSSSASTQRPSGDSAPPPRASPRETAGEPSVLRRNTVAFPAGVRPLSPSKKINVRPSGDKPLASECHEPPQIALGRFPRGLTRDVDSNGVSGQQNPAVRGDVMQHEPIGRAVHDALDSRERDGMQLRSRRLLAGTRGSEPDLASRRRPSQSNARPGPARGSTCGPTCRSP